MPAPDTNSFLAVERYLSQEESGEVRHEYVDGRVFPMTAENSAHERLTFKLAALLQNHLGDGALKTYLSDTKLRLSVGPKEIFYYPDLMVAGDSRDTDDQFLRYPKLIIEVLSPATERLDRVENFSRVTTCATLEEYVLISHDKPLVTLHTRKSKWAAKEVAGLDGILELASIGLSLPLKSVYGSRRFSTAKKGL